MRKLRSIKNIAVQGTGPLRARWISARSRSALWQRVPMTTALFSGSVAVNRGEEERLSTGELKGRQLHDLKLMVER